MVIAHWYLQDDSDVESSSDSPENTPSSVVIQPESSATNVQSSPVPAKLDSYRCVYLCNDTIYTCISFPKAV